MIALSKVTYKSWTSFFVLFLERVLTSFLFVVFVYNFSVGYNLQKE